MSKKYDTFVSYLEDVYYEQFFNKINSYIFSNKKQLGLSSTTVSHPSNAKLDSFKIMGAKFHEIKTDGIECQIIVRSKIEISRRSRYSLKTDTIDCWLSIPFLATLRNGLKDVLIGEVSAYSKEQFRAEDALTKHLVPYIYAKDLDKHAEKFLKTYCPRALEEPMPLPLREITEKMGLSVYFAQLPDGIFGCIYFNNAVVDVYKNIECKETIKAAIYPGTILVNPEAFSTRNIGLVSYTIIHECVHWDRHYKFFELQKLLNPEIQAMSCTVVGGHNKKPNQLEDEISWMEWQANALAPRILIPTETGKDKLSEILDSLTTEFSSSLTKASIMELAINEFADFFHVSTTTAKIRALEFGFEQADGVFNFADGRKCPAFSFGKGALKKGQTFVIDRSNIILESLFNSDLADDFKAGRFIHVGGLFVINDPKYVKIVEDSEPTLTDYALEHVDECCLLFDRKTRVSSHYDDSFYQFCFLCRDVNSKSFVETTFNSKEGKNEDVVKRAREMASIAAEAKRISDMLADVPSSFYGTLDYHIKRRKYTNEKMEERTGISSRMIQNYRKKKDAKPTLPSVLAMCIGLNLQPSLSYDLIAKAGYNIMIPSEECLIYRYLIDNHHMENLNMWNEKLQDAGISQQLPKNGNKNTDF